MKLFALRLDEQRDAALGGAWAEVLDGDERARADRFRRADDRTRYLAAHALARVVLGTETGLPPASLRFGRTTHGKPVIEGICGPHFNLTHTEGLVACAVHGTPIGCDAEPAGRVVEPAILDLLADGERDRLLGLPSDQARNRAFIRLWVVKEAFVKCLGLGLLLDPATYSFDVTGRGGHLVHAPPGLDPGRWHVTLPDAGRDHVVAVATGDGVPPCPGVQWVWPETLARLCLGQSGSRGRGEAP